MWLTSIIVALIISVVAIAQFYGVLSMIIVQVDSRPSSTMGNPIFLAIYLIFNLFIAITLAMKEENSKKKALYIFIVLVFFYTIFIAVTRAAFLGVVVGLIYFALFYPKKHRVLKAALFVFLLLSTVFVLLISFYTPFNSFVSQNKTLEPVISRVSIESVLNEERFYLAHASLSLKDIKSIQEKEFFDLVHADIYKEREGIYRL